MPLFVETTLWQGIRKGIGLVLQAVPTALTAFGSSHWRLIPTQ